MNFIKKHITRYIEGYLKELDIESFIRGVIKNEVYSILVKLDLSKVVSTECNKYILNKVDDSEVRKNVLLSIGFYIKQAIEDKKTFAEITNIRSETVSDIVQKIQEEQEEADKSRREKNN